MIDIQNGTLINGLYGTATWGSNQGSMNIGSSGTLDLHGAAPGTASSAWSSNWDWIVPPVLFPAPTAVIVDGLTGNGTITNNYAGVGYLTIGIANGSSTFSGSVVSGADYNTSAPGAVYITKTGAGTFTFNGSADSASTFEVSGGVLTGSGTFGNLIVDASATFAPGNLGSGTVPAASMVVNTGAGLEYALGTGNDGLLNVSGNVAMSPSGTLTVTRHRRRLAGRRDARHLHIGHRQLGHRLFL